jgi:transaldolase
MRDVQQLFLELALADVGDAADLLLDAHVAARGRDGFVSLECTPDLADDTEGTIAQAAELWRRLARPNVLIKVPATDAGVPAIEELTARGININVTLLFSVERYEQVIDAYMSGIERRVQEGRPVDHVASVASFFVSRVDTKVDPMLGSAPELRGRVAIANAARAYARWQRRFAEDRWRALEHAGARSQRPLWASTGTKDPAYSDVLYVEQLVAPEVINTMPEATLRAFADHGGVQHDLRDAEDDAERTLTALAAAGVDLGAITAALEREGVAAFAASYDQLAERISQHLDRKRAPARGAR